MYVCDKRSGFMSRDARPAHASLYAQERDEEGKDYRKRPGTFSILRGILLTQRVA